jgi:glycosyltransferase involved in cell wall biosynthesis
MKLSVIIPCYNEKKTILKVVKKLINLKLDLQIIIVDDFSTDGSSVIIKRYIEKKVDKVIYHKKNMGKGKCIIDAKKYCKGDYIIIQDADLEYNPSDYYKLLRCATKGYKVVYGSRVLGKNRYLTKCFSSFSRIFFNHILTELSNLLNNQKLSDAHTCYKLFNRDIFFKIKLKEYGFCFCPEITTKIGLNGVKIKEIPIMYNGRNYSDGKKIKFKDGIKAVITLFKYRFFK